MPTSPGAVPEHHVAFSPWKLNKEGGEPLEVSHTSRRALKGNLSRLSWLNGLAGVFQHVGVFVECQDLSVIDRILLNKKD